jgi:DNA-binding response OmpR family regulator
VTDRPPARARILIVEDHDDLAEALAINVSHAGHDVERVRDGREALMAVRARTPDLILLDLNLPRMDGFSVLDRLRNDGVWMPVLILSARGASADKVEGFRLGADDYVTKPFSVGELLGRVSALLRRSAAARASEAVSAAAASGASGASAASTSAPGETPDVIGYTDEELVTRFGLTLRQAAVARLLARGLTNPEIAAALAISRFTARNHAEQVLAKLGVVSRGRVAAALRAAYDADQTSAA